MSFKAQYKSVCSRCGALIVPGEEIEQDEPKESHHVRCPDDPVPAPPLTEKRASDDQIKLLIKLIKEKDIAGVDELDLLIEIHHERPSSTVATQVITALISRPKKVRPIA